MNDESNQLERRLEQATARHLPAGTTLDSETAALREGWLALGQLLEAVESASGPATPLPALPPSPPRRSRKRWWQMAGGAALATSLLIAGVLTWELTRGKDSVEHASKPSTSGQSVPAQALPGAVRDLAAIRQPAAKDKESWDGTLDESIANAYQELIRIEQNWNDFGSGSASVSTRLEEMGQELEKSTI